REHDDFIIFDRIQQRVGELAQKNSAHTRFDLGPLLSPILNELSGVLVRVYESSSRSVGSHGVPPSASRSSSRASAVKTTRMSARATGLGCVENQLFQLAFDFFGWDQRGPSGANRREPLPGLGEPRRVDLSLRPTIADAVNQNGGKLGALVLGQRHRGVQDALR